MLLTCFLFCHADVEHVGHGHGMLLLTGSKLCRELNVIRESLVDETEELEKAGPLRFVRKPLSMVLYLFTNPVLVWMLTMGALLAAWVEVLEFARPGGHHGAVLLALNELIDLREEAARPVIVPILRRTVFRLTLVSGAAAVALFETVVAGTAKQAVGAHHGVLILGLAKTLRCVGLVRKERNELKEEKQE